MPDVTIEKKVVLDLLDPKKPGTSVTSDVPVVETQPDSLPKKAAPEEGKTQDLTATPDDTESASADPEAKKPAKGVQKRLDELTRNWREEERSRKAAEDREARLLALLEQSKQAPKAETVSTDDPEPAEPDVKKYTDQEAYNADFRAYLKTMARWEGRQEFKAQQKRDSEERTKKQREDEGRRIAETYHSHVAKAKAELPDYDAVAGNPDLVITRPMADAIVEAEELGPKVAYHLGQNPSEAERISKLSPRRQFIEIGRIAAKLETPAPVAPVSKAPAPIKPLATGSTASRSSDEESMEAYAAKRTKQLNEERRPGARR